MDFTMNFANALKNRRKELKMSQEDVARLVGTTKQVVSKYENGIRSPKVTVANKYAKALGMSLEDMLGIPPQEETPEDILLRMFRGMNETGQAKLMERAEELLVLYGKKSKTVSNREAL